LPEYSAPPLTEVALSVQFEPLQKLVVPEIGLLWQHYGKRFTHVEQHPLLDPAIERLGARPVADRYPKIERLSGPPLPRIWFIDKSKRELLQIQQDRFIRNWRQISDSDDYPRYEKHIKPRFIEDLNDFQAFVSSNKIGDVTPNQCEITYINHILSGGIWKSHSEIYKVFSCLTADYYQSPRLRLEDVTYQFRYEMNGDNDDFIGRLYCTVQPAMLQKNNLPIFVFTLVARGKPLKEGFDGVLGFMDLGREYIVNAFTKFTRPEMHKEWGRTK
jgi:uncharacterized protein (TIGR04255 family)